MAMNLLLELAKAVKSAAAKTLSDALFPNLMTKNEAIKILGLDHNFSREDLVQKYGRMYSQNAVKNKGSPYIQKKISNAYQFLDSGSTAGSRTND